MGKIIKLKEEDLIPGVESAEQIYPSTITKAATTTYEDYPGSEVIGQETVNLEDDLKNLWEAIGDTAIKPNQDVSIPYDGNPHLLTVPSTCRYTLTINTKGVIPTEPGEYYYTARVKTGYVWRDGGNEPVTVTQKIYEAKKSFNPSVLVVGKTGLVYTGTAQALCTINKPTDYTGEVQVSLDGGTTWQSSVTGTDSGKYTILVKADADDTYEAITYTISVNIACATIEYPKITTDYEYTGNEVNAKYLDGTNISYDGTTSMAVLTSSVLKATEVLKVGNNPLYFKPRTNYVWATTGSNEIYELGWNIKSKLMTATWYISYSYTVNATLPTMIAQVANAELAFFLCDANGSKLKQITGGYKFTKEDVGTKKILIEYAQDYPSYKAISNPLSEGITITEQSNVVEWNPSVVTSAMLGTKIELAAKATQGKIVFRKDSVVGDVVTVQPVYAGGYYRAYWTPTDSGTQVIYACNVDWDDKLYVQAEAVPLTFSIESQAKSTITWNGDTTTHYVGDTLTFDETAIKNDLYQAKAGKVKYYLGDFTAYDDAIPPSIEPITSPYTIKASDVSGLTVTAFNVDYESEYVEVAHKVVKSFNVANRSGDMTIGTYSESAYIDTPWTLEVTIPSGTIDFRLKTSEGWSSMKGDSRATITDLGNNKYKLSYLFIGPAGRVASIQIHNTPATGYNEPTNQDYEISVGILAKANVITRTLPTTQEVTAQIGDIVNFSAYATSGYVQYWNGNPDDLVNPGTLITEGYNQGATGEACTLSNFAVSKTTTYIYMRNIGYDGAYSQASDTYVKINASQSTPLYLTFEGGATGKGQVGTPLTYAAKIKDAAGTDYTSEFTLKYTIDGVEYSSGAYTPTATGTKSVIVTVTNPEAKTGYKVTPASTAKVFTITELVAWMGTNTIKGSPGTIPTTEAEIKAGTATSGFSNWDTSLENPVPLCIWVAVKNGHTANITNSFGAEALSSRSTAVSGYTIYYTYNGLGYKAIINCVIN